MHEEIAPNFIEEIIETHLENKAYPYIHTRFPPEPNGYLHLGHCSAICLNFGLAQKYNGKCNLRFDDTNPSTEETEYVENIKKDIQWLGFQWDNEYYASDYFNTLYQYAHQLILKGLAYVDDSTPEEIALQKGDIHIPGTNSQYRNRSTEENTLLFTQMKEGKYPDGEKVLRAKIDMAHPNLLLRDPIIYRIKHTHHHRTANHWCIYPMYDFAHGQCDSIEQITHSICTLEFIPHRPLYDWFIEHLNIYKSKQYEFARVNINYTVMSKRKLLQLVQEKYVDGWDDPRMPTISGIRRRGYTPQSIHEFCKRVGVSKRDKLIEVDLLEFCVREHLNQIALRRMVILHPIKVIITNYPDNTTEELLAENNPEDKTTGYRSIPFSKEIWIDKDDFMENPPKKYFRLAIGTMVRLKYAYIIQCNEVIKNQIGEIIELHCTYIPESKSGADTSNLKVKGTIHWLSSHHTRTAQINLYDRLFNVENPNAEERDFKEYINPHSLTIVSQARIENQLCKAIPEEKFQFLRLGYFCVDKLSTPENLIFNRTVTLKDSWAKEIKKETSM